MKIKVMHSQLSLKTRSFMLVLRKLGKLTDKKVLKNTSGNHVILHILSTNY